MNYEFFHWCCHVQDDRILRHVPFVNTIRRHHIAHHNTAIMMNRNMNLTYPFSDWLFGTSDLNRGMLGHLFNGYDTRFVRRDLPKVRSGARPRPSQWPETRRWPSPSHAGSTPTPQAQHCLPGRWHRDRAWAVSCCGCWSPASSRNGRPACR